MNRPWLGSFVGSMLLVLACGDDGGEGEETDDGTGTGTTMMTTTNPSTTSPTGSASATGTSTGEDTESADTGSSSDPTTGEVATDTDPSGTGSTGSTGATEDGSGTGTPGGDYPACEMDEDCSDPYTMCWPPENFGMPNFCTLECEDAETDCPVPTSGTAVPVCEGPPDTNICVLDCTDGECPDGMECIEVFMLMRCSYPAE